MGRDLKGQPETEEDSGPLTPRRIPALVAEKQTEEARTGVEPVCEALQASA